MFSRCSRKVKWPQGLRGCGLESLVTRSVFVGRCLSKNMYRNTKSNDTDKLRLILLQNSFHLLMELK